MTSQMVQAAEQLTSTSTKCDKIVDEDKSTPFEQEKHEKRCLSAAQPKNNEDDYPDSTAFTTKNEAPTQTEQQGDDPALKAAMTTTTKNPMVVPSIETYLAIPGPSPTSSPDQEKNANVCNTTLHQQLNPSWFDSERGMQMRHLTEMERAFLIYWTQGETWPLLQTTGMLYSATKGYYYPKQVTKGKFMTWNNLEDWAMFAVEQGIPGFDKLDETSDRLNLSWFVKSVHVDKAALRSAKYGLNGFSTIRALPTDGEILSILRQLGFTVVYTDACDGNQNSITRRNMEKDEEILEFQQPVRIYPPGSKLTYYDTLQEVRTIIRRTANLSDNLDEGSPSRAKKRRRRQRQITSSSDSDFSPQMLLLLRVWATTSPDALPDYDGGSRAKTVEIGRDELSAVVSDSRACFSSYEKDLSVGSDGAIRHIASYVKSSKKRVAQSDVCAIEGAEPVRSCEIQENTNQQRMSDGREIVVTSTAPRTKKNQAVEAASNKTRQSPMDSDDSSSLGEKENGERCLTGYHHASETTTPGDGDDDDDDEIPLDDEVLANVARFVKNSMRGTKVNCFSNKNNILKSTRGNKDWGETVQCFVENIFP